MMQNPQSLSSWSTVEVGPLQEDARAWSIIARASLVSILNRNPLSTTTLHVRAANMQSSGTVYRDAQPQLPPTFRQHLGKFGGVVITPRRFAFGGRISQNACALSRPPGDNQPAMNSGHARSMSMPNQHVPIMSAKGSSRYNLQQPLRARIARALRRPLD